MDSYEATGNEENVENLGESVKNNAAEEEIEAKNAEGRSVEADQASQENEASQAPEEKRENNYKEKYFYLAAEMDNLRKRVEREKSNLVKFGNEKLIKELIEVIDNFERTVEAVKSDEDQKVKNIASGVDMIRKQFLGILENFGLKEIKALGEEFDPHFHEAVGQEAAEGKNDMEITKVYQKGYELNSRVIRASKVVVAKNS